MRIVTIQNRVVWDNINNTGVHEVEDNKTKYNHYKATYDVMRDLMAEKLGENVLPVWGIAKAHGQDPIPDINWEHYVGMGHTTGEDVILLELEIDESKALVMDYYHWTDFMYFLEYGPEEDAELSLKHLFNLSQAHSIQVCIPRITRVMVIGAYELDPTSNETVKIRATSNLEWE